MSLHEISPQGTNESHELTSDELDSVNGGLVVPAIIATLIPLCFPPLHKDW